MKIAYCIAATYNAGGMERVLANKANYLIESGHDVHIITTDQQGKSPYFSLDNRVKQHDLGINYCDNVGASLLKKISSYNRKQRAHQKVLAVLLKEIRPDITISMFDHEVPFLWKITDGSKKIVEIHFSRFKRLQYGRRGVWRLIDQWRSRQDKVCAARYARFVVLTEEDKTYWGTMPNIVVIPNANSFEPPETAKLENTRAIAVGRYDYQKGFDELIAAWAIIAAVAPRWTLHIFGKGPLRAALLEQIAKLGLQQQVFLEAPVADITNAYLQSSVLVMTSRYEGLPMALLEAQVCGLPLLAYACKCGPRDIIEDGANGYLIEEGNQKMLAERLLKLLNNKDLREQMGVTSKRYAANFSQEKVMKKWLDLFHQLINKPDVKAS